jgi:adenylylsulfate kinase-like enzyme
VYALLITGPPGSGKSTTLEALSDRLHDQDIAHACLDADALSWAHPAVSPAAQARHVSALSSLYRDEGYDLLLVAGPIASAAERDVLIHALGADDSFVVRLDASGETLHERIVAREPAGWSHLGRLLKRAGEMSTAMASLSADLALDTTRTEPAAAAARISKACPRLA